MFHPDVPPGPGHLLHWHENCKGPGQQGPGHQLEDTRVNIAFVSGLGLVVAIGLAFLSRRKVERLTRWVDDPAYDKLGTISRECLNDYVRQGR